MRIKRTPDELEEYRRDLLEAFPPGSTAYTILRHVSASGMTRWIDVYAIEDGRPRWMSYRAAAVAGLDFDDRRDCIKIGGAGMDMGFAIVYNLSSVLYREGFECIGDDREAPHGRCPSNDHSNGDRDYTPHHHESGGYAIRHSWI